MSDRLDGPRLSLGSRGGTSALPERKVGRRKVTEVRQVGTYICQVLGQPCPKKHRLGSGVCAQIAKKKESSG